jgi:hypothetical protein
MSTVAFNGTYSLSTVQNAFYSLPDLAQVLTPDGGLAIGPDQTVPEALGELAGDGRRDGPVPCRLAVFVIGSRARDVPAGCVVIGPRGACAA